MTANKNIIVAVNGRGGLIHRGNRAFRDAGVSAVWPPIQAGSSINIDEELEALFPANMQMWVSRKTAALNANGLRIRLETLH